jgi:hypothetical protein
MRSVIAKNNPMPSNIVVVSENRKYMTIQKILPRPLVFLNLFMWSSFAATTLPGLASKVTLRGLEGKVLRNARASGANTVNRKKMKAQVQLKAAQPKPPVKKFETSAIAPQPASSEELYTQESEPFGGSKVAQDSL